MFGVTGVLLTPHTLTGYHTLHSRGATYLVHVLVCTLFHGERPSSDYSVDHIDRDTSNNRADNLRWATRSEQSKNRVHNKPARAKSAGVNKPVIAYADKAHTQPLATFTSQTDAAFHAGLVQNGIGVGHAVQRAIGRGGYAGKIDGRRAYWAHDHSPLEQAEDETWVPIDDSIGRSVSNLGRIRTINALGTHSIVHDPASGDSEQTLNIVKCYYYYNYFGRDGVTQHNHNVHRLVMLAHGPLAPSPDHVVDHIDGNKLNNRVDNLRWLTPSENTRAWVASKK